MGDFNVDLLKTDLDKESDAFLQHNLSFCLNPFIIRPTRVTPHSRTLIDNIFSNSLKNDKTKQKQQSNTIEYRRDYKRMNNETHTNEKNKNKKN